MPIPYRALVGVGGLRHRARERLALLNGAETEGIHTAHNIQENLGDMCDPQKDLAFLQLDTTAAMKGCGVWLTLSA